MKRNPKKFVIKFLCDDQGDTVDQVAKIKQFLKNRFGEFGQFSHRQVKDRAMYSSDSALAYPKLVKLLLAAENGVASPADYEDVWAKPADPLKCLLPGSIIVVAEKNLLAVDEMDRELLLARFCVCGIDVYEASTDSRLSRESVDITQQIGEISPYLLKQIWDRVRTMEKANQTQRIQLGRKQARRQGRHSGPKGYGSLPEDEELIKRIRELRQKPRQGKRVSYRAIANRLAEEGFETRSGKTWTHSTVRHIVQRYLPHLLD